MTPEQVALTASLIGAVFGLGGAAIGSFVTYKTAALQFKATAVSAERQKWIESLRSALSEYMASVSSFAVARFPEKDFDQRSFIEKAAELNTLRYQALLYLTPGRPEHDRVDKALFDVHAAVSDKEMVLKGELPKALSELIASSQVVLKEAWDQSKEY